MDDLTPNDLSHMSDEDFNALCPQGHHALGAEPLSPAAQAVLNAADGAYMYRPDREDTRLAVAAALRAAAYQVAPARPTLDSCCEHYEQAIRHKLLAIATELEGQ